ncbi:MAG: outer membrane lipoprotein LolB [Betaproteobacteria bacterium]
MAVNFYDLTQERRAQKPGRRFHVVLPALLLLSATMLLQGCATVSAPSLQPASSTAAALPAKYFELQGRISVRVGERLDPGKITWTRSAQEERIKFFTPLGSQVAELVKVSGGPVTLRRGQETLTAATFTELTATMLGVPLDMDAIAAWTQGIGLTENESVEKRFGNGDVWQVTAEKFQSQGAYRFASRLTAISAETVVRLVIDEWHAE